MKVYRLIEVEVPDDLKGICWNESMNGKIVWKRADAEMCSVGIIRRGRRWGDYGGRFCAECPYFLASGFIYGNELELLRSLAEKLDVPVNELLDLLSKGGSDDEC